MKKDFQVQIKELADLTSSISILYIEDDKHLKEQNHELFQNLFKLVDIADNGVDAIKLYETNDYELVITDINIPLLSGLNVIKQIKDKNPLQSILITSVFKEDELKKELEDLHTIHYLTKPLETKTLLKEIEVIVKNLLTFA